MSDKRTRVELKQALAKKTASLELVTRSEKNLVSERIEMERELEQLKSSLARAEDGLLELRLILMDEDELGKVRARIRGIIERYTPGWGRVGDPRP